MVIATFSLEMVAGTKGSSWKPDSHSSALTADRNPRDGCVNMSVKTVLNTIIAMLLIDCHKVLLSVFLKGERGR